MPHVSSARRAASVIAAFVVIGGAGLSILDNLATRLEAHLSPDVFVGSDGHLYLAAFFLRLVVLEFLCPFALAASLWYALSRLSHVRPARLWTLLVIVNAVFFVVMLAVIDVVDALLLHLHMVSAFPILDLFENVSVLRTLFDLPATIIPLLLLAVLCSTSGFGFALCFARWDRIRDIIADQGLGLSWLRVYLITALLLVTFYLLVPVLTSMLFSLSVLNGQVLTEELLYSGILTVLPLGAIGMYAGIETRISLRRLMPQRIPIEELSDGALSFSISSADDAESMDID